MLLDNPYINDRRVYCEAVSLAKNAYSVTIVATKLEGKASDEIDNGVRVVRILENDIIDIKTNKQFIRYRDYIINNFEFDVLHAHDQYMLHLGALVKQKLTKKVKLVYDSHELYHEWPINLANFNNFSIMLKSIIVRKLKIRRERKNGHLIDRVLTVNNSLAKILFTYFKQTKEVGVVRNLPNVNENPSPNNLLREKFNISADKKILIYIGRNVYRYTINIEQVLQELKNNEKVAMVFICGKTSSTIEVMNYVKDEKIENVYFHDMVHPNEMMTYLQAGDVGIVSTWNKKDKSYWLALGNKFFEYIQAGVPVLTTIQPEYLTVMDQYKCGVAVNPDVPNAYLKGYNEIISNYEMYRNYTLEAAKDLCWENEEIKLLNFYNDL